MTRGSVFLERLLEAVGAQWALGRYGDVLQEAGTPGLDMVVQTLNWPPARG